MPGALKALAAAETSAAEILCRHQAGDWGELSEDDCQLNNEALRHGERILSAYRLATGTRLWVITEADRTSTCILLPEEY
jgi:hypothetical protein